jgi:hypothetical protein
MNIQVLTQVTGSQMVTRTMLGFCPSSKFCFARVFFWAVVNFATIAPAMT